jgi:predicted glycoside hydrolase/deacetylase ChbG (UPF0249 family)
MGRLFWFCGAAALALPLSCAADGEIRLIVQGDDMGAAHSINAATIKAYKEGILRVTNIMMPGPWVPEAARLLNENPGLDAGVHLTLTSDWERVKWRPLTAAPSLVDAHGYFYPMVWPNKNFPPRTSMKEAGVTLADAEKELRAQIELARRMIPHVSYVSAHMGCTSLSPEFREMATRVANEYKVPFPESVLKLQWLGRTYDGKDSAAVKAEKLAQRLESVGPGTWITVDHAGEDTPEMQGLGHIGYENVAADRSAVLAAWTSPRVLEVVKRRGIKLTSYRELLAGK